MLKIDYDRHEALTASGVVLHLKPVSNLIAAKLQNQIQRDYPKPPVVKVIIGDEIREQENPLDPEYLASVRVWQVERSQMLMVYVWTTGVVEDVPDADRERLALVLGGSPSEIKYAWVMECVGNEPEDWGLMTEAIMGQTFVTSQGVEDSLKSFPGDDRKYASPPISFVKHADAGDVQPRLRVGTGKA